MKHWADAWYARALAPTAHATPRTADFMARLDGKGPRPDPRAPRAHCRSPVVCADVPAIIRLQVRRPNDGKSWNSPPDFMRNFPEKALESCSQNLSPKVFIQHCLTSLLRKAIPMSTSRSAPRLARWLPVVLVAGSLAAAGLITALA